MVTVLALLGVAAVLFAAAVLATSDAPMLAEAPPDAADLPLPDGPMQPEDIAAVRFSLAPRGYRMAEVDEVLARLADELADRDRRLALLEAGPAEGATTSGAAPPAVTVTTPAPDAEAPGSTESAALQPVSVTPDLEGDPLHR